ncbi:outer membrane autotransporter barrel domain-containing protein, partial [Bartonella sp. DB5-6]|uniref:autotransporter outer membrane beta-barrel domain-containing protein n=1 Tax=Bartonella sp. DB5-6 TaxID=1094755 RepID=UPI00026E98FD
SSSLSTVSLSDSRLIFDNYMSNDYQTLHIGKKINTIKKEIDIDETDMSHNLVYIAEGNSRIQLNTSLYNDGLFDPQKTDRVLIYGDVSGTTLVHMQNFQKTSDKEIRDEKDQSISLIQVFGSAQEDSFKLSGSYTTVNGFPYQYRLRAYGPSSSSGTADPKNRLVAGDGEFWDFRLESIYISPEDVKAIPVEPVSTDFTSSPAASSLSSQTPSSTSPTDAPSLPSTPNDSMFTSVSSMSSTPSEPPSTDPMPEVPLPPVTPSPSPSEPSDTHELTPVDPSP